MAVKKTSKSKIKTLGFVNYEVELPGGGTMRSNRGFPIFANPEYPDAKEELLIKAALANGGTLEIKATLRIFACDDSKDKATLSVEDLLG